MNDIADDVDQACDFDGASWEEGFIWINYDVDVPGYLTSDLLDKVSIIGFIIGLTELVIFCRLHLVKRALRKKEQEEEDVSDRELEALNS